MRGINRIRFSKHPLQEKKLNLFVDYFNYFVNFAGYINTFEIDNPLSITEKMIYQIQHNPTKQSIIYIENHYKKLKKYSQFLEKYKSYSLAISILDTIFSYQKDKERFRYLDANKNGITLLLAALQLELDNNMLKDSVEQIKNQVLCNHSPEEHLLGIMYYTQIVASEIIMNRRSKAEAQDLFNEIMTNDYKRFPYPRHILSDDDKKKFFNQKTVHDTINAILNFCEKETHTWYILFKIDHLVPDKDYVFSLGNVKIYSIESPKLVDFWKMAKKYEDHLGKDYFEGDNYSICEVETKSVTYSGAHRLAVRDARHSIEYINKVLNTTVSFNHLNYFFTTDRKNHGYTMSGMNGRAKLTNINQQQLDDNAYQFFVKKKSAAEGDFLNHERDYISARDNEDIDRLWHYMEVINRDGTTEKKVKEIVSGALMLYEKKFRVHQIEEYLRRVIHVFCSSNGDLGITFEEQVEYQKGTKSIKELNKKIESLFFNQAYKEMMLRMTRKRINEQRQYYISILIEAYEQRNHIEHKGSGNNRADTKLKYTFPLLTVRYRWVLFNYMNRYPKMNLEEIVNKLRNDVIREFGTI